MKPELDPRKVRARLARLRELYRPESVEDGQARLARERPSEPFALAVARRFRELRALDELTRYLHRKRG
jgi:hypothetical protein